MEKFCINNLHEAVLSMTVIGIMDFQDVNIDCRSNLNSHIVGLYKNGFQEKPIPEEIFAEYLSMYLQLRQSKLSLEDAELILKNMHWVLKQFNTSYIISCTENSFSSRIRKKDLHQISQNAVKMNASLNIDQKHIWGSLIQSLKNTIEGY